MTVLTAVAAGLGWAVGTVGRLNFPAHAHVARLAVGDDPAVLFGAMLPDLVAMAGSRFGADLPPGVEAGQRLHHRTDERFHDAPAFRAGVGRLRSALGDGGLASGPRRAAAHLGYELVLDTCLPWDDDLARALAAALAFGSGLTAGLPAASRDGWEVLLGRLSLVPWAGLAGTGDGELAQRVEQILGRRPRLALPPGSQPLVAAALGGARPGIHRHGPDLFASIAAALADPAPGER